MKKTRLIYDATLTSQWRHNLIILILDEIPMTCVIWSTKAEIWKNGQIKTKKPYAKLIKVYEIIWPVEKRTDLLENSAM